MEWKKALGKNAVGKKFARYLYRYTKIYKRHIDVLFRDCLVEKDEPTRLGHESELSWSRSVFKKLKFMIIANITSDASLTIFSHHDIKKMKFQLVIKIVPFDGLDILSITFIIKMTKCISQTHETLQTKDIATSSFPSYRYVYVYLSSLFELVQRFFSTL